MSSAAAAQKEQPEELVMCHCGRPIHYTDDGVKEFAFRNIKVYGDWVDITDSYDRIWKVQRHYAFLHPSRVAPYSDFTTLGFEEVVYTGRAHRPDAA